MKKKDIILIAVLLCAALLTFLVYRLTKNDIGNYVLVTVNNQEYGRYPLSQDNVVEIQGELSGSVIVMEIKAGAVSVLSSGCPDKVCVSHASVHYNGEAIICLPNQTVIRIISDEAPLLDAVVKAPVSVEYGTEEAA